MALANKDRLTRIINLLFHEGLRTHNPKASKAPILAQLQAIENDKRHKKGAIYGMRDKSHFTEQGVKGFIMTSMETVLEKVHELTHFTPNIYRSYGYADGKRKYIKGFEEKNLLQINAFVIDIDTKKHSVQDILLTCHDDSVGPPTGILGSSRGYQALFLLTTPIFLSNKNDFRSLTVAKRIANNLKRSLQSVDADMYCNDFGFFRAPNVQNIEWFDETAIYTPANLIEWSKRQDDDLQRPLFVVPSKKQVTSLTQSEWFHRLISITHIKGKKGQIARNNLLFTIALACFQDGKDRSWTFDLLDRCNSNFQHSLPTREVNTIIDSAYSGKYRGPKKEYIEHFLAVYVKGGESIRVHLGNYWYKHKKARKDRQRSHRHEWEQDIINYITAEKSVSEPLLWCTQKELCDAINISSSTLNKLLKESKIIMKTTTGKGRNAKTGLTTVKHYSEYIIHLKKDLGTRFAAYLRQIVQENMALLASSAGYTTLLKSVQNLLKEQHLTEQLTMMDALVNAG